MFTLTGQNYSPSWESLDKRPTPGWFEDSKFGIFIHWGIYSVPAWGPAGDDTGVYDKYSEWYWNKLMNKDSRVNSHFAGFHFHTYGPHFKYQDFAPIFRAEPPAKASLLGSSGTARIRNAGGSVAITLPRLNPDDYQLAYVIRISNL